MSDDSAGLGGFDLGSLVQQAQAMQEQLAQAQEEQAQQVVQGTSGGGKVVIDMTGGGEFLNVKIAPDALGPDGADPDDVELLEELILAALRDAHTRVITLQEASMNSIGQGMDLGGLGGMLGLE